MNRIAIVLSAREVAARGGRSSAQRWQVWRVEVAGLAARGGRSGAQRWQVWRLEVAGEDPTPGRAGDK